MREQEQKIERQRFAFQSLALLKSVTVHPVQAGSQSATYVPKESLKASCWSMPLGNSIAGF